MVKLLVDFCLLLSLFFLNLQWSDCLWYLMSEILILLILVNRDLGCSSSCCRGRSKSSTSHCWQCWGYCSECWFDNLLWRKRYFIICTISFFSYTKAINVHSCYHLWCSRLIVSVLCDVYFESLFFFLFGIELSHLVFDLEVLNPLS